MRTRALQRYAIRWLLLLCLMVMVVPPGVGTAQEETAATDPPAATDAPSPPESPLATEVPATDPPVVVPPTVVVTDPPSTEPVIPIEVGPTVEPTETATVTPSEEPFPTETGRELAPAALARAAPAPTGAYLTVDGQTDVAYVPRGGTQTFQVGDLLDMPSLVPDFINASNPDPDFYNFNGWWTSNDFLVYATPDCSGQWIREFYTPYMQPGSATATATMSGAVQTYSVQASQQLSIWWLERKIDVVDSVDEVTTFPAHAVSNCVTVKMSIDYISLLANGSTGPITINESDPIGLQTDQPSGDGWTQYLLESKSDCTSGSVIAQSNLNQTVSTTLRRPPGTYWYIVRSVNGSSEFFSNCTQVTVQSTSASLLVDASTGPVEYITGQELRYYAQGFSPGAWLTGLVYLDSSVCNGTPFTLTTGAANDAGALDISRTIFFSRDVSVQFVERDASGEVREATNCVTLWRKTSTVELKVNGSLGPVLVDGGEIHLLATGLPTGSEAHAVTGCSGSFEPDDFGQVIGADGVFEAYLSDDLPDEFTIRVALAPPSTISSNCVTVRLVTYLIDPVISIDGSETPDLVTAGTPFEITGVDFPPDAAVTVRAYSGSAVCTGDSTPWGAETDAEGNLILPLTAGTEGTMSFQAQTGFWTSNCLTLPIDPAPVTEVPVTEVPVTEVPSGPITLSANGVTEPQVVAGGTRVELATSGLGSNQPYSVVWYPTGDCSGTPRALANAQGSDGVVGTMTRYVASTISFKLTSGDRASNCVQVSWLAVPVTEIPGTEVPSTEIPGTEVPSTEVPGSEVPVTEIPVDPTTTPPTETPAGGEPTVAPTSGGTSAPGQQAPVGGGTTAGTDATTSSVSNLPVTGAQPTRSPVTPIVLLLAAGILLGLASLSIGRNQHRR